MCVCINRYTYNYMIYMSARLRKAPPPGPRERVGLAPALDPHVFGPVIISKEALQFQPSPRLTSEHRDDVQRSRP